jgi:hypothetical protein
MVIQVAHVVRPAKLVTPDLEAHCERMTHKGDMIVLEGSVLLLSKKHAQPVRVEGQRILVNLKDGSFTVESVSSMTMPAATSFGIMRTSLVEPATCGSKVMVSGFQFDQPLPEMNLLNRYIGQFYSGREIVQFEDLPSRQWLPTPATSDRIIRVVPVPPMLPPEVPARSPATPIWMPK